MDPNSTKHSICIIILHYKDVLSLSECISSLSKLTTQTADPQILIVDNGSHLNGERLMKSMPLSLSTRIITSGGNIGYAAGNNNGIREALNLETDYILLLNDDTVVAPDFLDVLLETAETTPSAGILGPKIYYFDEPRKIWFAGARFDSETCMLTTPGSDQLDDGIDSGPLETDYITGCALLIKRHVLERIGFLDERFFLYWEDVDWGLRSKKAGLKNIVVPRAHIWHKVSASAGGIDSLLRIYHKTRSHLLLARLHAPQSLKILHMHLFRDIAWLLMKSSDRKRFIKIKAYITALKDYYLGRTGKGPEWIWTK
jgi:GT2 family glycosyltransferase